MARARPRLRVEPRRSFALVAFMPPPAFAATLRAEPSPTPDTRRAPEAQPDDARRSRHRVFAVSGLGLISLTKSEINGDDYDEGADYIGTADNGGLVNP